MCISNETCKCRYPYCSVHCLPCFQHHVCSSLRSRSYLKYDEGKVSPSTRTHTYCFHIDSQEWCICIHVISCRTWVRDWTRPGALEFDVWYDNRGGPAMIHEWWVRVMCSSYMADWVMIHKRNVSTQRNFSMIGYDWGAIDLTAWAMVAEWSMVYVMFWVWGEDDGLRGRWWIEGSLLSATPDSGTL